MKYFLVAFVFLATSGCSVQNKLPHAEYVEYRNSNTLSMRIDGSILEDKMFSLKIPLGMKKEYVEITNVFLHTLEFDHKQEIVVIYNPFQKEGGSIEKLAIDYDDFKRICQKEGHLEEMFNEKHLLQNRFFGIEKNEKLNLFIIYLNVKKNNVDIYNSALKSFSLIENEKQHK